MEKVSFRFLKESTQEDKDHEIVGEIVSFIPNKELSYTWNFTTKPEYNKNTIVTWKLEQLDKDKTKLTLIHSGFTNADRLPYDDHNKGWSWHIKRLENIMDKIQMQTKLKCSICKIYKIGILNLLENM